MEILKILILSIALVSAAIYYGYGIFFALCRVKNYICDALPAVVAALTAPLANCDGYIAIPSFARSGHDSNAPPTAPPDHVILATALLPTIFDDLTVENPEFSYSAIRHYCSEKLIEKIKSYPGLFESYGWNLDYLERRLKYELYRLLLTVVRDANNIGGKVEPSLQAAREALITREISFDATLPDNNGKVRSFHDVLGTWNYEPLSLLIAAETETRNNRILAALSDDDKARLLAEYEAARRQETGELFELLDNDDSPTAPARTDKYRRIKTAPREAAPSLFAEEVQNV